MSLDNINKFASDFIATLGDRGATSDDLLKMGTLQGNVEDQTLGEEGFFKDFEKLEPVIGPQKVGEKTIVSDVG